MHAESHDFVTDDGRQVQGRRRRPSFLSAYLIRRQDAGLTCHAANSPRVPQDRLATGRQGQSRAGIALTAPAERRAEASTLMATAPASRTAGALARADEGRAVGIGHPSRVPGLCKSSDPTSYIPSTLRAETCARTRGPNGYRLQLLGGSCSRGKPRMPDRRWSCVDVKKRPRV
jgi:hypothetical protein